MLQRRDLDIGFSFQMTRSGDLCKFGGWYANVTYNLIKVTSITNMMSHLRQELNPPFAATLDAFESVQVHYQRLTFLMHIYHIPRSLVARVIHELKLYSINNN